MSIIDIVRIAAIGLSVIVILLGALLLLPGSNSFLEKVFTTKEPSFEGFSTLQRTGKPNDYLVCPEGLCTTAEVDELSPIWDVPVDQLKSSLTALADTSPNIALRSYDPDQSLFSFVERTPTMRFPDLIWVQIFPVGEDQSEIAIYSRSVYGYSDVGVNEKRVKRWMALLAP